MIAAIFSRVSEGPLGFKGGRKGKQERTVCSVGCACAGEGSLRFSFVSRSTHLLCAHSCAGVLTRARMALIALMASNLDRSQIAMDDMEVEPDFSMLDSLLSSLAGTDSDKEITPRSAATPRGILGTLRRAQRRPTGDEAVDLPTPASHRTLDADIHAQLDNLDGVTFDVGYVLHARCWVACCGCVWCEDQHSPPARTRTLSIATTCGRAGSMMGAGTPPKSCRN